MSEPTCYAFIPSRAGSKRLPGKNTRVLAGHPLLAYTIAAAQQSGVFARIIVSTEDERTKRIAEHYGAEVPFYAETCAAFTHGEVHGDNTPDIAWVQLLVKALEADLQAVDAFAILRPTSPLRSPWTIQDAFQWFAGCDCDSLREVAAVREHPGKMWISDPAGWLSPYHPGINILAGFWVPDHSAPTQTLPEVLVQTAGLEIAHWHVAYTGNVSISGPRIVGYRGAGERRVDLNTTDDWEYLEWLVETGRAALPRVDVQPWRDE